MPNQRKSKEEQLEKVKQMRRDLAEARSVTKSRKGIGGRPTVMDDEVLNKLREAFAMGCTDEEACLHAEISPATLYNYQKENEEFLEEKKQLKNNPMLQARSTVVRNLRNVDTAKWYLEKKARKEFGGDDKEESKQQFNFFISDQQLADQLLGFIEGVEQGTGSGTTGED